MIVNRFVEIAETLINATHVAVCLASVGPVAHLNCDGQVLRKKLKRFYGLAHNTVNGAQVSTYYAFRIPVAFLNSNGQTFPIKRDALLVLTKLLIGVRQSVECCTCYLNQLRWQSTSEKTQLLSRTGP